MNLTHKTHTPRHPELGTGPIPIQSCIDPAIFEQEREAIFGTSWINVGRVETIPNPCDYFVRDPGRLSHLGARRARAGWQSAGLSQHVQAPRQSGRLGYARKLQR